MALKKHFGNSRNTTEIAVNLERRMNIKKVVGGTLFKKILKVLEGVIAVFESGIETNRPGS